MKNIVVYSTTWNMCTP